MWCRGSTSGSKCLCPSLTAQRFLKTEVKRKVKSEKKKIGTQKTKLLGASPHKWACKGKCWPAHRPAAAAAAAWVDLEINSVDGDLSIFSVSELVCLVRTGWCVGSTVKSCASFHIYPAKQTSQTISPPYPLTRMAFPHTMPHGGWLEIELADKQRKTHRYMPGPSFYNDTQKGSSSKEEYFFHVWKQTFSKITGGNVFGSKNEPSWK